MRTCRTRDQTSFLNSFHHVIRLPDIGVWTDIWTPEYSSKTRSKRASEKRAVPFDPAYPYFSRKCFRNPNISFWKEVGGGSINSHHVPQPFPITWPYLENLILLSRLRERSFETVTSQLLQKWANNNQSFTYTVQPPQSLHSRIIAPSSARLSHLSQHSPGCKGSYCK